MTTDKPIDFDKPIEAYNILDGMKWPAEVRYRENSWITVRVGFPTGGEWYPFEPTGDCLVDLDAWRLRNVAPAAVAETPSDPHRPLPEYPLVTLWNHCCQSVDRNCGRYIKIGDHYAGFWNYDGSFNTVPAVLTPSDVNAALVWNPSHKLSDLRAFVEKWMAEHPAKPDYSKGVTPKGRAVEFRTFVPQATSCYARIGGFTLLIDGNRVSDMGNIRFDGNEFSNSWAWPSTILTTIDAWCDANGVAMAEKEKPVWVEGQRFKKINPTNMLTERWYVHHGEVYALSSQEKSWSIKSVAEFESLIRSGAMVPAETPKPLQPFTLETFPKGEVWLRTAAFAPGARVKVVGICADGIIWTGGKTTTCIDFAASAEELEISLDGGSTWQACGVEQ